MIGQKNAKKNLIECNAGFIILVGQEGSGRHTLISEVYPDAITIEPDVASTREVVDLNLNVRGATFVIDDYDSLSDIAKFSLLKTLEDVVNNRFIMIANLQSDIPDTLQSRAVVIPMDIYTVVELLEYADGKYGCDAELRKIVAECCKVPQDVDKLMESGGVDFIKFIDKVLDNILNVTLANALKLSAQVVKEYNVDFFLTTVVYACTHRFVSTDRMYRLKYAKICREACKCLSEKRLKRLNDQMVLDSFVLRIRRDDAGKVIL